MRVFRCLLGLALLAFQCGAIVYARWVPSRYFCWAPYDMQTDYQVEVTVNGRTLASGEVAQRYRRPARGTDNRSTQHLLDIFEQTEQRYHAGDTVAIVMKYRVNGKAEQEWRYQQP